MNPRICICCGEAMLEEGHATHSRNPNLCASCSSLVDGMEEPSAPSVAKSPAPARPSQILLNWAEGTLQRKPSFNPPPRREDL